MWPSLGVSEGTAREAESAIFFSIAHVDVLNGTPLTSEKIKTRKRDLLLPPKIMILM